MSDKAHDDKQCYYPRDNALELARSKDVLALAWKAGFGNETLKHPDQALLARSFLAIAGELEYRESVAPSAGVAPDAVDAAIERMLGYPDGSYMRCPFCGGKSRGMHKDDCPIVIVAAALRSDRVVPVYEAEPELLEALIELCRALHQHPDAMMPDGSLYKAFINAFAVVQAYVPPPPPLLNATEHSMDLPNG